MENDLYLLGGVIAVAAVVCIGIWANKDKMKKGIPRMPLGPPTGLANVSDRTLRIYPTK